MLSLVNLTVSTDTGCNIKEAIEMPFVTRNEFIEETEPIKFWTKCNFRAGKCEKNNPIVVDRDIYILFYDICLSKPEFI